MRVNLFATIPLLLTLLLLSELAVAVDTNYKNQFEWQYFCGDIDADSDDPSIFNNLLLAQSWRAIDYPANPIDRGENYTVWFKTTVPDLSQFRIPALFIYSIDLMADVYLDGEKIYQHGDILNRDIKTFYGWPWHGIELPKDAAGKTLFFRVFSNYNALGFWGPVGLVDKKTLPLNIIKLGYKELVVALFSIFVALLTFAFAIIQHRAKHLLYLSAFSLASALMLISENPATQLVFNEPLVRTYLLALSYFSLPIWLALLLSSWTEGGRQRIFNLLVVIHVSYILLIMILCFLGVMELAIAFPIFDGLFAISLLAMLAVNFNTSLTYNSDRFWLIVSFCIYAVFLLIDMLVANDVVDWSMIDMSPAALVFSVVLLLISLKHFSHVHQSVYDLNHNLELKIADRTAELHDYIEAEKKHSAELKIINEMGTRLESFISMLQSCRTINQAKEELYNNVTALFSPLKCHFISSDKHYLTDANKRIVNIEYLSTSQIYEHFGQLIIEKPTEDVCVDDRIIDVFVTRVEQSLRSTLITICLREELERFSFEDSLTGLKNRRYFDEALHREIQLAMRNQSPLSLMMIDIDHFKLFNDTHGHEAGDFVLKRLGAEMLRFFRKTDVCCRLGGEEFVAVLPDMSITEATEKAEGLRKTVASENIRFKDKNIGGLTISIGVSHLSTGTETADKLLSVADQALYDAKSSGRDKVEYIQ